MKTRNIQKKEIMKMPNDSIENEKKEMADFQIKVGIQKFNCRFLTDEQKQEFKEDFNGKIRYDHPRKGKISIIAEPTQDNTEAMRKIIKFSVHEAQNLDIQKFDELPFDNVKMIFCQICRHSKILN